MMARVIVIGFLILLALGMAFIFRDSISDRFGGDTSEVGSFFTLGGGFSDVVSSNLSGGDSEEETIDEPVEEAFTSNSPEGLSVAEENIRILNESAVPYTIHESISSYYAKGFVEDIVNTYDISPYAGSVVFLDRLEAIRGTSAEKEYLVLRFDNRLTRKIDITGWKLVSRNNGAAYPIPKAVHIMGNPESTQTLEPILVDAGSSVVVSSGRSPTGFSFLINKCSGYRSQFKKFTPSIKTKCSKPLDEFIEDGSVPYTDTACYSFVKGLSSCSVVTDIPSDVSKECRTFLEKRLTEGACVRTYINDPDFFSAQWRVFLESGDTRWDDSDNTIYLFDRANRLVTAYVY